MPRVVGNQMNNTIQCMDHIYGSIHWIHGSDPYRFRSTVAYHCHYSSPTSLMGSLIIDYGLPRTGTTWVFNAAINILNEQGLSIRSFCASSESERLPINEYPSVDAIVVKAQKLQHVNSACKTVESQRIRILLTLRDPGDTILSRIRVGIAGKDATKITSLDATRNLQQLRKAYRKMERSCRQCQTSLLLMKPRSKGIRSPFYKACLST